MTLSHLVPPQQDEKLKIIDNLNLIIPPSQLDRFAHVHEQSSVRNALIKLGSALDHTTRRPSPNLSNERLINLREHVKEFIQYADKQKNPADAYARLEISLFKLLPRTMLTLREAFKATPFGIDNIPGYLRSHWISADGVHKVMIIPKHDLNSAEHLKNFVNQVLNAYPSVFGLPVGDVNSGQAVVKAFVQAFSSALVLIILLLLLLICSLLVLPALSYETHASADDSCRLSKF